MGGLLVDGPMLGESLRSFIGYCNVPYCHGLTIAELARYFNQEYKIGCTLKIVKMKGWKRFMTFQKTGLQWIAPSPHIPEPDTPFFYASTGLLGELGIVNIGVGYTLPFKLVGHTFIKPKEFCRALNAHKLPGVQFEPITFKPFYSSFKDQELYGARIHITDANCYQPVKSCYTILSVLKSLYPKEFHQALSKTTKSQRTLFNKANGTTEVLTILQQKSGYMRALIDLQKGSHKIFLRKREQYLLYPSS